MGIFLKWLVAAFVLIVLLIVFFPNIYFRVPALPTEGRLTLSALKAPVEVIFDNYAVPHVYAENEHDLFYAGGYLMAAERLFQMDMFNRAVQGRLAEMDASLVAADRYLRMWGFHRIGRRIAAAMDPETRQLLMWSCQGINDFIRTHRDRLPLEFQLVGHEPLEWDPAVVAGFTRLMAHELHQSWYLELLIGQLVDALGEELVRDVFPAYPNDKPFVVPPGVMSFASQLEPLLSGRQAVTSILGAGTGFSGSNNWVLAGSRTETGQPILANDIHLGFTQPAKMYEMHLVGGRFNVMGLCFAGVPVVILGHNEHIAWGTTNLMADDADFYEEEPHPDDPSRYRYKGRWLPFQERQETIQVRDGESVTFTVRESVHGVIINEQHGLVGNGERPIAMRWTGQDVSDEISAYVRLNLARNWDDFSAAARLFALPGQNKIYADREGNIGWRPFVRLPRRVAGAGKLLMPGSTGEWDWQGYLPFEALPFRYNPPEGYIATANNKTVGAPYPHYISAYWAPTARIERITELLAADELHSIGSVMAIQYDQVSAHARETVPFLLAAFNEGGGEAVPVAVRDALAQLRRWDYSMSTSSVPTAIFNAWFVELVAAVYRDEMDRIGDRTYNDYLNLGALLPYRSISYLLKKGDSPWFDDIGTPAVEGRDDIIRRALVSAVERLSDELGGGVASWRWGRLHTLSHTHDLAKAGSVGKWLDRWLGLNVGPFPAPGAASTVNPSSFSLGRPFKATAGPAFRLIMDLGDLDRSRVVLPSGQSGNPFSRHYDDQAELFMSGRYRDAAFSRGAVERHAAGTLILLP